MNKRQMLGSGGGGHAEKGEEVKKGGVRTGLSVGVGLCLPTAAFIKSTHICSIPTEWSRLLLAKAT